MRTTSKLLPLALLAASQCVSAQQIPGAGAQLRQITPPAATQRAVPTIRIEQAANPATAESATATVLVNALQFSGAQVYPAAELLAITGFTPGSQLTLGQLQAMAARITEHYRAHGYFVARAYLPAQDITGNVVTIAVSEGKYGKVSLRNQSNLDDGLANGLLNGLDSGDTITLKPLEHRLLLLSDVPGVKVSSTLVPGTLAGTSDLLVDVTPGRRVSGQIDADNAGNPYTGENRLGATINFNNLAGRGDVASLRVQSSGSGLVYGRASYQMQFGRATAGVAYSHLDYALGRQFTDLGAHGTADVASIYGSLPLIRSRNSNLYFGLGYDDKSLKDELDLFPSSGRTAHARVANASLYGNHQDSFGGGGNSAFFVALSAGDLDIRTPAALAADAATARTNGHYSKLWFNVSRGQHITDRLSLNASLSGQRASKNLDPSEKFVLGGMDGVRAYPQGEAFGDEGYLATVEARLLLGRMSGNLPGQLHLVGFVDAGRVTINKNPWYAGTNERNLSGAGVGITWDDPGNFAVRTYYARKLGSEDAMSAPDRSGRFWIQAIKYF
ncbi:ShlB/FhaC/HecB family hemolysin secretion/activation protein [soil metagenome]